MSSVDYEQPRLFWVTGYMLAENGEGHSPFDMQINERSVTAAIAQVEYVHTGRDIRIVAVRPV